MNKKTLGRPAALLLGLNLAWHLLLLYTKKDDLGPDGVDALLTLGTIDARQKTCYIGWYASLAITAVCLLLILILRQKSLLFGLLVISALQILLSFMAGSAKMLSINEKLVPIPLPVTTAVLSVLAFLLASKSLASQKAM